VQVQPLHDIEEESINKILDFPLDAHFDVPMGMSMDMGWEGSGKVISCFPRDSKTPCRQFLQRW